MATAARHNSSASKSATSSLGVWGFPLRGFGLSGFRGLGLGFRAWDLGILGFRAGGNGFGACGLGPQRPRGQSL